MSFSRILLLITLIVTAGMLQAHEIWMIPDHTARPGQPVKVAFYSGTAFPGTELRLEENIIGRFPATSAHGELMVGLAMSSSLKANEGAITFRSAPAGGITTAASAAPALKDPGTYVVGAEFKPSLVQLDAKAFDEFLAREGLGEILDARAKAKKESTPGSQRQTAFAKTIVYLGEKRDASATRALGLKLEIVPEQDPETVLPGEKLPVRVLFDGKPLGNVQVTCASDAFVQDANPEENHSYVTRTSYQGIAMIPIQNPGNWMVRLVHMIPAVAGQAYDWDSYSTTLTFRTPPERGFPLTIDSIMRGNDLVGYGISALRWSGDSSKLYFDWRKPGERKAYTYLLSRTETNPRRLSSEEARLLPPPSGNTTRDRRKIVFADNGAIILQDTVTNERIYLLRTAGAEGTPRFTRDERYVTFVRDGNLYRLSLTAPELVQLTDNPIICEIL